VRRRRRRGEGSVYKSQGSWIAHYPLGTVNGKRQSKRKRCKSEREALGELERMRRIYGSGGTPTNATLGSYLTEWVDSWHEVRDSTRTSYRGHIDLHISPLLGGIPLSKLQPSDVRRLIEALQRKGLKAATIVRVVTTLRIALNAAVAERTLSDNAAEHVRLPRVDREPVRPLHLEEADAILRAVGETWIGPIVRLLLGSGLRLGEAIGLDQRDLLLDAGFVRVRRSKTEVRAVPISDDAIDALREALTIAPRLGPDEPVFYSPRKPRERLQGWSVSHALPRVLAAAGLQPLTPHALRHGAATLMLADGHPMRVIAEQLGHRNPALTSRVYAHVIPEAQRAAVGSLPRRQSRS
jgi:integrase